MTQQQHLHLPLSESELYHESEILRNPFHLKTWLAYLEEAKCQCAAKKCLIYERALRNLPSSYKLWRSYLQFLQDTGSSTTASSNLRDLRNLRNTYNRCLHTTSMHKMPRLWLEYLRYLANECHPRGQATITRVRRAFDRALRSLPVTQHEQWVWPLYLDWCRRRYVPTETGVRVYRRYLKAHPEHREEFVAFLKARERFGECAQHLAECVRDPKFVSLAGKTRHQLWLELCDLITSQGHQDDERSNNSNTSKLDVVAILQSGIRRYNKMNGDVGRLWLSLGDYYIRRGSFSLARDVYAEALDTVKTVRDFSLVYDASAQFEESIISAKMGEEDAADDLDFDLARLEHLVSQRPLLLNSVVLRQNPHNVGEWFQRVKILQDQDQDQDVPKAYLEALQAVDPKQDSQTLQGKYYKLWTAFAEFYEERGLLDDARQVLRRAVEQSVKPFHQSEVASVWCHWAEMEIKHKNYAKALELMREATAKGSACAKNQRAWMLRGDLTESLGTLEEVRQVYDQMLHLKIATPQIILNFATILEEKKFFEEAFKAYEKGVSVFQYPHSAPIWKRYLAKFVDRYKGTKVERGRELFERCIEATPQKSEGLLAACYLQYASFEELHGLAKNVMSILDKAVKAVASADKMGVYEHYLKKASAFFGVAKTRSIYQNAIEEEPPHGLADEDAKRMCLRYANLEKKLGEIDRARAILRHGAQLANPQRDGAGYWDAFKEFEVSHGNEDTFREMLRVKRSVAVFYSQANMSTAGAPVDEELDEGMGVAALEAANKVGDAASNVPGFVKAETMNVGSGPPAASSSSSRQVRRRRRTPKTSTSTST
jgi:pre-mRNA-splicing factor SYF1